MAIIRLAGITFDCFYPFLIALCVVWVLEVINIFESLVVLNFENHTVELTGLAYTQEFDIISRAKDVTQWRKISW